MKHNETLICCFAIRGGVHRHGGEDFSHDGVN